MGTTQDLHHEATNSASSAEGNSNHSETDDGNDGDMLVLLKFQALEFNKFQHDITDHNQGEEERQCLSEETYRKGHGAKFFLQHSNNVRE